MALLAASFSGACANDGLSAECRFGSDCASGVCGPNGLCVVPDASASDASVDGSGDATSDRAVPDAALDANADVAPDAVVGCVPMGDGEIRRDETPLEATFSPRIVVAEDVGVDNVGASRPDGSRTWDLTGPFAGEQEVNLQRMPVAGAWFGESFPTATYAAPLLSGSNLLGVFEARDDALLLLGVVSPDDGFLRTELENSPPVPVLQFPMSVGTRWTADTTVTGLLNGVISTYTESYEFVADAQGALSTPAGSFDVLRLRTTLTRLALVSTVSRRLTYLAECEGQVGQVVSRDNETDDDFTRASELWRRAP
ncbi:MAG: hypothetical protein AAGF12_12220 [Myxococcota bacterium]